MKPLKQVPGQKQTTEDPELAERFNRVLNDTVEAMEESGLRYAFIGGIASGGLGRPRSTHDIDLFVPPEEAELALRALAKKGFKTEKTDPSWLYKAFKEDILVDIIFKSKGEIYFDSEMHRRTITAEFHGKRLRLVAPEDLLIIKSAAHSELTPNHWHDAVALLAHASFDWKYLLSRAKRAPRRVLSLLLYAQSSDIGVPNQVVHELYNSIFDNKLASVLPLPSQSRPKHVGGRATSRNVYGVPHLRQRLAEDPRTNELDIQIEEYGEKILLRGEVASSERREAVAQIARELFPQSTIENQIRVPEYRDPAETEEIA